MDTKRKFVEDKVYLKGPDGQIWEYEALLANTPGYVPVTPNPSKKAQQEDEEAQKAEAERLAAEEEQRKQAEEEQRKQAEAAAQAAAQAEADKANKPK